MMLDKSNTTLRNRLYLLTFAHAVVDAYSTTLPHLLPLLFRKLVSQTTSWSSLAGLLIAVSGIFNSFSQVVFGQLADQGRTAVFLIFGVAIPSVCTSLMGVVPSLLTLMLLLIIGGMAVAAFHPPAAVQAAILAKRGRGFGVSLFITGGKRRTSDWAVLHYAFVKPLWIGAVGVVYDSGASCRLTRCENQLLSTSHGRSRNNNNVFAQCTEEGNPLDCPPARTASAHRVISHHHLENRHDSRGVELPIIAP